MMLRNTDAPDTATGGETTTTTPMPPASVSNADRLKAIEAEVGAGLELAGNIAGAIDPALIPFIVLGKAAAAALPGLIDDVQGLIDGQAPDAAANSALAAKISSLGNPETL